MQQRYQAYPKSYFFFVTFIRFNFRDFGLKLTLEGEFAIAPHPRGRELPPLFGSFSSQVAQDFRSLKATDFRKIPVVLESPECKDFGVLTRKYGKICYYLGGRSGVV